MTEIADATPTNRAHARRAIAAECSRPVARGYCGMVDVRQRHLTEFGVSVDE